MPQLRPRNIIAAELTYRIGILTDFVALLLFIFLVVSLYDLLKGGDKWHAMLMVLLVSVGVTIGLANLVTKIAPLIVLSCRPKGDASKRMQVKPAQAMEVRR